MASCSVCWSWVYSPVLHLLWPVSFSWVALSQLAVGAMLICSLGAVVGDLIADR